MIIDKRVYVRELGLRQILKAMKLVSEVATVRDFVRPKINFGAQDYTELIDWSSYKVTSPRILHEISTEGIFSFIESKSISEFGSGNNKGVSVPHIQVVELCVKLVRKASEKVCDSNSRDGYRSIFLLRSLMPKFDNESHFKALTP